MPRIVLTVTNDLHYDRRMQRIAGALAEAGYEAVLVGRVLSRSPELQPAAFEQVRLRCRFNKGFLFYAAYNLRLWVWLMTARYDAVCSVDLDTLVAGCLATLLRRKKRVYDAHEYFTEVPEVVDRPFVKGFWAMIARICLPFYRHAYTVGPALAKIFEEKYRLPFSVVRNVPLQTPVMQPVEKKEKVILYQGALNEGRGIETALEAMQYLEGFQLWLAGEGDLSDQLRAYAEELGLGEKVRFLGFISPSDLDRVTAQAWLGLNLFENRGLNYYYSLANKFFSYVQLSVPSLNMDFPEYRAHCDKYRVGLLLTELSPEAVVGAVLELENAPGLYQVLQDNCRKAAREWNWEVEKRELLKVWEDVFRT